MGKDRNQREGPENQTNSDTDEKKFNAGAIARITMAGSPRIAFQAVKAESVKSKRQRRKRSILEEMIRITMEVILKMPTKAAMDG